MILGEEVRDEALAGRLRRVCARQQAELTARHAELHARNLPFGLLQVPRFQDLCSRRLRPEGLVPVWAVEMLSGSHQSSSSVEKKCCVVGLRRRARKVVDLLSRMKGIGRRPRSRSLSRQRAPAGTTSGTSSWKGASPPWRWSDRVVKG